MLKAATVYMCVYENKTVKHNKNPL